MSKVVLLSDIGGIKTSNEAFLGQDAGTGGRNRARIRDRDRGGNRTVARTHMG